MRPGVVSRVTLAGTTVVALAGSTTGVVTLSAAPEAPVAVPTFAPSQLLPSPAPVAPAPEPPAVADGAAIAEVALAPTRRAVRPAAPTAVRQAAPAPTEPPKASPAPAPVARERVPGLTPDLRAQVRRACADGHLHGHLCSRA
jgi:hypothetical protein